MFGVYVWDVVAPACAHTVGRWSSLSALLSCSFLSACRLYFPVLVFLCLHLILRIALADFVGMFALFFSPVFFFIV